MLGNINSVSVSNCDGVFSLAGLGKGSKKISLAYMKNVSDFTPVKDVRKVHISNCVQFPGGSHLQNVQYLTLEKCVTKILKK
jgi:hypothetical protein